MGAMNGNPSMRSSTGAGTVESKLHLHILFCFFVFFSPPIGLTFNFLFCLICVGSSRGTSGRSVGGGSTSHSSEGGSDWTTHDTGPHREMAVDVPDTFVGRTKTPPRYPPPKPAAVVVNNTTSVPVNNNSPGLRKKVVTAQANQVASNGMMKPAPPSRDHLRTEEDGRTFVINHPAPSALPSAQVCVSVIAFRLYSISRFFYLAFFPSPVLTTRTHTTTSIALYFDIQRFPSVSHRISIEFDTAPRRSYRTGSTADNNSGEIRGR